MGKAPYIIIKTWLSINSAPWCVQLYSLLEKRSNKITKIFMIFCQLIVFWVEKLSEVHAYIKVAPPSPSRIKGEELKHSWWWWRSLIYILREFSRESRWESGGINAGKKDMLCNMIGWRRSLPSCFSLVLKNEKFEYNRVKLIILRRERGIICWHCTPLLAPSHKWWWSSSSSSWAV